MEHVCHLIDGSKENCPQPHCLSGFLAGVLPTFIPYIHRNPSESNGNQDVFWWKVSDFLLFIFFPFEYMKFVVEEWHLRIFAVEIYLDFLYAFMEIKWKIQRYLRYKE